MPKFLAELDEAQTQDNLSQQIANATLVRIWSRIANAVWVGAYTLISSANYSKATDL